MLAINMGESRFLITPHQVYVTNPIPMEYAQQISLTLFPQERKSLFNLTLELVIYITKYSPTYRPYILARRQPLIVASSHQAGHIATIRQLHLARCTRTLICSICFGALQCVTLCFWMKYRPILIFLSILLEFYAYDKNMAKIIFVLFEM